VKHLIYIFLIFSLSYSEPISPIPLKITTDNKKVALGSKLFFDTILSKDNTISCATCHRMDMGGADGLPMSFGINGQIGNINTPTVFNSTFNFVQFWDGRAKNLQEQAIGPIENPVEMGHNIDNIVEILKSTEYHKLFKAIYKDGVTKENITDAIAEFEKSLITPNSPFDNYLRGDNNAITQNQKDGYALFKSHGCISCHHGINIGGNLYAKFGVIGEVKSDSMGRFSVTKNPYDKYFFKVPTLRNIELTSPYLHNGQIEKLEDVVKFMSHFQLGKTLTENEVLKITDFLKSLTGELPKI